MQISKHKIVTLDYTLTNDGGEVLDTSKGQEPLAYIHGTGFMIPGLENALEGKAAGNSFSVTVEPKDGYGERDDELVKVVEQAMFGGVDRLEVGMQFQAETDDGIEMVTVTAMEGDKVTVDGNHPLADVTLNFEVQIVGVREASQEEIEHGHVHGAGGHDH
ncbi:MAG: peptidylprolyl isomerase [Zetaproteobacteria bacterium]|nr:MAG: peptidylprolyl isomerase [Zetaproteobacteria bacterium]